jgi:hypothetical protein
MCLRAVSELTRNSRITPQCVRRRTVAGDLSAGNPCKTAMPRYDLRVTERRQAEHYVLCRTDRIRGPRRWWCSPTGWFERDSTIT